MFLLAQMNQGKISNYALIGIIAALLLVVAAPILLIRELRRKSDEKLPAWMGTVRGRRIRIAIILGIMGLLIGGFVVWEMFGE